MAFFRRRRRFTRGARRRARWDMQTFRECETQISIDFLTGSTCDTPQIEVVYICGTGNPAVGTDMVEGISPAMMYGGGFLQIRWNAAVVNDSDAPCHPSVSVTNALVVLPVNRADPTAPLYLPNIIKSRSQVALSYDDKSDSDENILWWWQEQLDLASTSCGGANACANWPNDDVLCRDGDATVTILGNAAALYGRVGVRERVRVKRRLTEAQALFLVTNINTNSNGDIDFQWPVRRNVYHRYAVRRTR